MKKPKAKIYCQNGNYYIKIKWRMGYLSNHGIIKDYDDKEYWFTFWGDNKQRCAFDTEEIAVDTYNKYCSWLNNKRADKAHSRKLVRKLVRKLS